MRDTSSQTLPQLVQWATVVGGFAAAATIVGVLFHGCGHVTNVTHLHLWGIDEGLFDQKADWKVVNGYYAVMFQGLNVLKAIHWYVALAAFLLLAFFLLMMRIPARKPPEWVQKLGKLPLWARNIGLSLGQSVVVVYAVGMTFIFGLLTSIMPGLVGERAGREQFASEVSQIKDMPQAEWQELWQKDQRLARGKVIFASESRYAIFDLDLKQVRIIPGTDIELRAPDPTDKSALRATSPNS
ncbi:hypothetical protein MWN52_13565 [Pseudoxanthomonas winnipegensis]|uniref:hypothetical protein n=1 Tax=Pseudoxanthomonas winnipegensis TaxID=2480810 RepID=UPI002575E4B5|nr:hypothetical protein [Pseudoxanthomonas winnipegensis]WJI14648.1 hypothetical protein MWN52_13565 [Pseudoxanthomonas winnipegensis]